MISCGARLAPFDIPQLREIMSYDELELDKLGDEKSALFFLISDTDTTYNFLVALAFSQMFNLLCERADNTYGGRLPYHVRVLWDEAANTGQVPGLEKIVAVIRSREISLTLFYQAMSQCKALYKDHSETIMGNIWNFSIRQSTFSKFWLWLLVPVWRYGASSTFWKVTGRTTLRQMLMVNKEAQQNRTRTVSPAAIPSKANYRVKSKKHL